MLCISASLHCWCSKGRDTDLGVDTWGTDLTDLRYLAKCYDI
jgi:hypothetical protein